MTRDRVAGIGFHHPIRNTRRLTIRNIAFAQLLMSAGLVVSIVVAVTAVSIGIARADALTAMTDGRDGSFAVAILLGLLMAGMGGIVAAVTKGRSGDTRHG